LLIPCDKYRPNGIAFEIPNNPDLEVPPTIGDVITFEYDTYSRREAPFNPRLTRVRTDMKWEDVLFDYGMEVPIDGIK
jgi:hypothetical protein